MDPFVRRLIERLHDPSKPLSRNRHFHTFETPEGKRALRTSRRLKALQREILLCRQQGGAVQLHRSVVEGQHELELRFHWVKGRSVSRLADAELELLTRLPGVREALVFTGVPPEDAEPRLARTGDD